MRGSACHRSRCSSFLSCAWARLSSANSSSSARHRRSAAWQRTQRSSSDLGGLHEVHGRHGEPCSQYRAGVRRRDETLSERNSDSRF